jgi:hypothetical protein
MSSNKSDEVRKNKKKGERKRVRSKLEKMKESWRNKEKIGEASKCSNVWNEGILRSFFTRQKKSHENERKIVPKANVPYPPVLSFVFSEIDC